MESSTPQQVTSPDTAPSLAANAVVEARPANKLDLSRLSAPENLEEARLESFTIDGICGVY